MNTMVIGIGNIYRRDDALGPTVVELLRARGLAGVTYAESDGEPIQLIELWQDASFAVVIDAVRAASARPGAASPRPGAASPRPGRVHRLSALHPSAGASASSHGVDLGDAIALARALDRLPPRLLVYAVEVAETGFGVGLSPEVAAAAHEVAEEIADLLTSATAG
jgi:hydrogenase maturation protease